MMTNPIGPSNQGFLGYGYGYPSKTKTITTTREYDEKGNLVKEVVVETTSDTGYYEPKPYWQQNPVVYYGSAQSIQKADPNQFTINYDDGHTVTVNTETY